MPCVDQHLLEGRRLARKVRVLGRGAEAHDRLDAGAIVPGAVEEHDFARGRQLRDIALEIPLAALDLGRLGQRDEPGAGAG